MSSKPDKLRIFCRAIFLFIAIACKDNTYQPLAPELRDEGVASSTLLFDKLIGRESSNSDEKLISTLRNKKTSYEDKIDALLASEQFYSEGFWYLHKQRLIPGDVVASERKSVNSLALQLELEDVARQDNYWNVLTYRERWLPASWFSDPFEFNRCRERLRAKQQNGEGEGVTDEHISDCSNEVSKMPDEAKDCADQSDQSKKGACVYLFNRWLIILASYLQVWITAQRIRSSVKCQHFFIPRRVMVYRCETKSGRGTMGMMKRRRL